MSNWLKKFGSRLLISMTAFVLAFALILTIVFSFVIKGVKDKVSKSFSQVKVKFDNLSDDTINENYNSFLRGIVDLEVNSMEYVIDNYEKNIKYLSDIIVRLHKEYEVDKYKYDDEDLPNPINDKIHYYFPEGMNKNNANVKDELAFLSWIEDSLYYSVKDSLQLINCFYVADNGITMLINEDKNSSLDKNKTVDFNTHDWYIAAKATDSVVTTSVVHDFFSGNKVVSIVKSVKDNSKTLGVIGFDLVLNNMTFKNMGVSTINAFNVFVVNSEGQLVYNVNGNPSEELEDFGESLVEFISGALKNESGFGYYEYAGNHYRTCYKKVSNTDFTLFASIRNEKLIVMADELKGSLDSENNKLLDYIYYESKKTVILLIIILALVLGVIVLIARRVSEKMSEPLKELSDVLDTARNIQQNMLPKEFNKICKRKDMDLYAINIPEAEVGGDFYNYIINGNVLILIIADVSGSGIPAALFMAKTNTLLNTAIKLSDSPKTILSYVNYELCKNNKDYYFVTIGLYYVNLVTGDVISTNSGHENSILIKKNGEVIQNDEKKCPPLGLQEHNNYSDNKFHMERGDKLFLYTDGVVEAINQNEELYGINRLKKDLETVHDKTPKEIIDYVNNNLSEYAKGLEQYDDITMLCFTIKDIDEDEKKIFTYENEYEAKYESIDEIDEFIKKSLEEVYVGNEEIYKDDLQTIYVCVEEMVVNIIDYAYGGKGGQIGVKICINKNIDKLSISFIDGGEEFDPTKLSDPNILESTEKRKIGGLGVFVTKKKMDNIEYEYTDNKNVLTITKFL